MDFYSIIYSFFGHFGADLLVIKMWNKPGGLFTGARVVGKLSGDGRRSRTETSRVSCQGIGNKEI